VERQGVGIPGRDGLLHQIKQPQDNFRVAVRGTAPCFVPQYRGSLSRPASPAFNVSPDSPAISESSLQQVEKHTRPPFLEGEEDSGEICLNDGKEVFIDDVLQTAEWSVP
jgi:hypothetical protein